MQGTDYVYTIQGWIKGSNSNTLSPTRDLGKDGSSTTGNLNKNFAYDAAAYSLGYFTNDYKAIDATLNNTANSFLASETNDPTNGYKQNSYDLYNGNISRMVTVMRDATGNAIPVQGRTFRYDQLNRIKEVNAWLDANIITSNNWSTAAANNNDYYEAFTFDMNGNIETAVRNGDQPGTHQYMDNMTYTYTAGTNKLDYVNDLGLALSTDYDMDIDGGQTPGNYQYDAIGNLISDASEEIQNIEWNVQGKIVKITRTNTSSKPDLEFLYDASGQRIAKIVKPRVNGTLQTEDKWKYTIYARDASGNVMAVYAFDYKTMSGNNDYRIQHNLKEHHIYGGSRLGMSYDQQVEVTRDFTLAVSANGTFNFYNDPSLIWNTTTQLPVVSTTVMERELGYKVYELANHLGNVLATVSDRRIPVGSAGVISNFLPEVMTYTDYFVFGSNMPGRTYVNANGKYRYTFNGKEQDVESDLQDYGFRIYNPALGKFLSVDPLAPEWAHYSPYLFAGDKPINCIDKQGEAEWEVINYFDNQGRIIQTQIRLVNARTLTTSPVRPTHPSPTGDAFHTIDVTLDQNNNIVATADRGWSDAALSPTVQTEVNGMTVNPRTGRFTPSTPPFTPTRQQDFPSSAPMVDNVVFAGTLVPAVGTAVVTPVAGFVTPMTGVNDARTVNDISTLSGNGSIQGPITIQITGVALTPAEAADPVFVANWNNLMAARALTIVAALGPVTNPVVVLPPLQGAAPSATITYQRILASTNPSGNAPNPVGSGTPAPAPAR